MLTMTLMWRGIRLIAPWATVTPEEFEQLSTNEQVESSRRSRKTPYVKAGSDDGML